MSDNLLDTTVCSSLQLFQNNQFGKLRVIVRDGEPWFVAKDVCKCLELENVSQACARLDEDEVSSLTSNDVGENIGDFDFSNGGRLPLIVSEPGLYSLVGSSKKPEAKAFKRWVNHEVLPSIRKTGSYSVQPQPVPPPSYMIENSIERAERWIEEEKARLALASELSDTRLELQDTAKELDETQEALEDEIAQHAKDNEDFCEGVRILNRQKAQISSEREAKALARNADVVQREKIATWMTYVQKKQMGTLRLGKYRIDALLGTVWMRSCLNMDKYKDVKKWATYTATRRVTLRLANALEIAPKEASSLRECYVKAKMYGIPFEQACFDDGITPNERASRILSDCVSVVDTYECKKGDGETKFSPVYAYSIEVLGEVLCAMIDSKGLATWLRDDTSKDDFAWWVVEKASENYGIPVEVE